MPTPEVLMQEHRQQSLPVFRTREGDMIEIGGWPAIVKFSEPYSDHLWYLEVEGHFKDGDVFVTSVKIPSDVHVKIRRKPTRKENES